MNVMIWNILCNFIYFFHEDYRKKPIISFGVIHALKHSVLLHNWTFVYHSDSKHLMQQ
jgi:hypothetical protein